MEKQLAAMANDGGNNGGGDHMGGGVSAAAARRRGTNCDCIQGVGCIGVTAILCLSGLPADLTASILAHGE